MGAEHLSTFHPCELYITKIVELQELKSLLVECWTLPTRSDEVFVAMFEMRINVM